MRRAAPPSRRSGATRKVLQPAPISAATATSRSTRGCERVDGFQAFKDALTSNPQLSVTAVREPEYFAAQSEVLNQIIRTIGFIIAGLMGIGAIFGAVNTMYTAVASRDPRDRHAARARIRQLPRRVLRAGGGGRS